MSLLFAMEQADILQQSFSLGASTSFTTDAAMAIE